MSGVSLIEKILLEFDTALRTLITPEQRASKRQSPATRIEEAPLSPSEKRHIAGLMRVNHAGEVCAQALYQGQALTAQLPEVRSQMAEAAAEEVDHLAWCEDRLRELNSHPSVLNPLWYLGSLMIGAAAGFAGDRWSLGFVAETERQVSAHLQSHLKKIPIQDQKSKRILEQMDEDETQHAELAYNAGAAELPLPIKQLMRLVSKLMTSTAYRL